MDEQQGQRNTIKPLTAEQHHLVTENIGLARSQAHKTARGKFMRHNNASYVRQVYRELEQQAALGLCWAASVYDPTRGCQFSTIAHWYVLKAVNEGVEVLEGRVGPKEKLRRNQGKALLDQEGMSYRRSKDDEEREIAVADPNALRRDLPFENEEEDRAQRRGYEELLALLYLLLGERAAYVVRRRVLDGAPLREVGEELGISKERVRQVEEAALRKMRESRSFVEAAEKQQARHDQDRRADIDLSELRVTGRKIA